MDTKELFKDYYDAWMNDLKDLLRIPSVLTEYNPKNTEAPFGEEIRKSLDFMFELAKRDGFKTVNVDNYAGFIEWGEGDETVVILCHLDVVPATGVWTNPPFEPIIKGNKLYARGSSDDKGPLMAAYYALKMLKDQGYTPKKKIRFFFGCDEESGSRCVEHYIEKYPECDYGFSPDANFPCIYAEKGISCVKFEGEVKAKELLSFDAGSAPNVVPDVAKATITVDLKNEFKEFLKDNNLKGEVKGNEYTVFGKSAHGSTPDMGINAATNLASFLNLFIDSPFLKFVSGYLADDHYGTKLNLDVEDPEMGHTSSNPAVYHIENGVFTILDNLRYTKQFDFESKMKELEETVSKLGVKSSVLANSPYHYVSKDSKLIKDLLKAFNKWTPELKDEDREPLSIGGGTYARDFKNAVAFGAIFPNESECMHMPDEFANIDNLVKSVFIVKDAIVNLCD